MLSIPKIIRIDGPTPVRMAANKKIKDGREAKDGSEKQQRTEI